MSKKENNTLDADIATLQEFINTAICEQTDEQITKTMSVVSKYKGDAVEYECPICFVEKSLFLYRELMKVKQTEKDYTEPKYILKDNVNIIFRGEIINDATITDEKAETWIQKGLPLLFFKIYPKDEEEQINNNE